MAERVHPTNDAYPLHSTSLTSSSTGTTPNFSGENPKPPNPPPSKPVPPPPATYVFQLPKEQIFKYPPPENGRKIEAYTRRKNRRSCCFRCCCFSLCLILFLVIAAAVLAAALYLVYRPKAPKYTITSVKINGMNVTSARSISPEFDVTVRSENPNKKIGIYYLKSSSVNVLYDGVKLSDGILPAFYQPKRNVTVFNTALKGSRIVLGNNVKTSLVNARDKGRVPFVVRLKAPVKIKIGSVKMWEITVKVKCDVIVDALTDKAKIVQKDCDYSAKLW